MKTKYLLGIVLVVMLNLSAYSTTYTVKNVGSTFSPNNLSISVGDTVIFTLESIHNATEVNKDMYDQNKNTPNGGFSVPFGGGLVTFNTSGTYYYVCTPHASFGMKGIIIVNETGTQAVSKNIENDLFGVFPNPASSYVNLKLNVKVPGNISIDLIDMTGKSVEKLVSGFFNSGEIMQSITFQKNIAPGKYFVKYSGNSGKSVKSLLIIK